VAQLIYNGLTEEQAERVIREVKQGVRVLTTELLGVGLQSWTELKQEDAKGLRDYQGDSKVVPLTEQLCSKLNQKLKETDTPKKQLTLSFDAHFDFASIHPFYDGNGRTARLLMNFIQAWFELPLSIVFSEDKADYFEALEKTRNEEDLVYFREFMFSQYEKYLNIEIKKYLDMLDSWKKGAGFSLVFYGMVINSKWKSK